jgi:hypothetical protein
MVGNTIDFKINIININTAVKNVKENQNISN